MQQKSRERLDRIEALRRSLTGGLALSPGGDRHRDNEIKHIEECIEDCHTLIARLKTSQNALRPVARLPSELWAEIFVRCLPDFHESSERKFYSWLSITLVCKAWRDFALETARLWANVWVKRGMSLKFLQRSLRHSKGSPLYVRIEEATAAPMLRAIFEESHRFAFVDCEGSARLYQAMAKVDASSAGPMSSLETLQVLIQMRRDHALLIPALFERTGYPRLKTLVFKGEYQCPSFSSSIWVPTLTSVGLHVKIDVNCDLVDLLCTLPTLKILALTQVLSLGLDHQLYSTPSKLSALQELTVGGTSEGCVDLFSQFIVPAQANVFVDFTKATTISDLTRSFVPLLSGTNRSGHLPPFRTCVIAFTRNIYRGGRNRCSTTISLWAECDLIWDSGVASPRPGFTLRVWMKDYTSLDFMNNLFNQLPLQGVTSLHVDGMQHFLEDITIVTWMAIFTAMSEVTTLTLHGDGFEEALSSWLFFPISDLAPAIEELGPLMQVLHLQELILVRFPLRRRTTRGRSDPLMEILLGTLQERHRTGIILDALSLKGCEGVREDDIEKLGKVVGVVSVN